ncbi:MAG: 30S ribosomal protein S20 [Clostridiales bacterium]|jgi:small subunit ribosomal protein S20|nr:30S ribosomal protein S20 [Clostridiales bacterium]
MANIKSAQKRIKVTAKKTLRNKMIKSRTKTEIKKFTAACALPDKALAESLLPLAYEAVDKACSKGVFHKNTASRKKSRLARLLNRIA